MEKEKEEKEEEEASAHLPQGVWPLGGGGVVGLAGGEPALGELQDRHADTQVLARLI